RAGESGVRAVDARGSGCRATGGPGPGLRVNRDVGAVAVPLAGAAGRLGTGGSRSAWLRVPVELGCGAGAGAWSARRSFGKRTFPLEQVSRVGGGAEPDRAARCPRGATWWARVRPGLRSSR